jgi:hypothetical protein
MPVMSKPSIVNVATVFNEVGTIPFWPRVALTAIVKHPACAAANNSSGFVPMPSSKRVLNEYCVLFNTVLCEETFPFPVFKSPSQCADAVLFIVALF